MILIFVFTTSACIGQDVVFKRIKYKSVSEISDTIKIDSNLEIIYTRTRNSTLYRDGSKNEFIINTCYRLNFKGCMPSFFTILQSSCKTSGLMQIAMPNGEPSLFKDDSDTIPRR